MKVNEDLLTQDTQECKLESLPQDPIGFLGINGTEYVLINGINKVGRRKGTCNVFLDLESVSREHATIVVKSIDNISLFDLKSRNKTKLNMRELQPFMAYPLKDGDIIQFGDVIGAFKLFDNSDELPMTQDMGVPDTPVFSRSNFKSHTMVPETPDFEKDESFNISRNSGCGYSRDGIFLQPNRPAVKKITYSNKTKPTTLKFDFDTSIVGNVVSNNNSVHELRTQPPPQEVNIFNAETQLPSNNINNDTVVSNMTSPTKGQSQHLFPDIDIFNAETQLQTAINNETIKSNVTSGTKVQNRSFQETDIFNAETQLTSSCVNNKRVNSNKEKLLEKDIEEEEENIDEFMKSFESQSLLTNVEEEYTIIKTESTEIQAPRILSETKYKIENIPTKKKNIMVTSVDDDLTDCEDEDIFEDTNLPKVQEIPKCQKDIFNLETQLLSNNTMTVEETTNTNHDKISKSVDLANNMTIIDNDLEDLPTQIIGKNVVTSNVNIPCINDMPTQLLDTTDSPRVYRNLHTIINKKKSQPARDDKDVNYDAHTQEVFVDLMSSNNSSGKINTVVENYGKSSKSNNNNKCRKRINTNLTSNTNTDNDQEEVPTQIIGNIEVTSLKNQCINDMPTQMLSTTETPSVFRNSHTSLKNKKSQLLQDDNEDYYAATQEILVDLMSPNNSMGKINTIMENDGKSSKSNNKSKCRKIINTNLTSNTNTDNDQEEVPTQIIGNIEVTSLKNLCITDMPTQMLSTTDSPSVFRNSHTSLKDKKSQLLQDDNEDYYAATQEILVDLMSPNNSMENIKISPKNSIVDVDKKSMSLFKMSTETSNTRSKKEKDPIVIDDTDEYNNVTQILEDDIKMLKNDKIFFTKNLLGLRGKDLQSKITCDDFGLNQVQIISDNFDKKQCDRTEEKGAPNGQNNNSSSLGDIPTQIIANLDKEITSKTSDKLQNKNKQSRRHRIISKRNKSNNNLELNNKLCIEDMPTQIIENHLTPKLHTRRQLRDSSKGKNSITEEKINSKTNNKLSSEHKSSNNLISNDNKKVNKPSINKEKESDNVLRENENVNTKVLRNNIVNNLDLDDVPTQLLEFEEPPKTKDKKKKDKTAHSKKQTKKVNEDIVKHSECQSKAANQTSIKIYLKNTKSAIKKQNENNQNVTEPRRSQRKRKEVMKKDSIYSYEDNNKMTTRSGLRNKSHNKTLEQSAIYDTSNSGSSTRKRSALDVELAPSKKKNKLSVSDTKIPSTSRIKRTRTCKVLFTALSNDVIRDRLIELGAVIVNEVRPCTVVVTQHIKRTFKMMCALGLGKPIVGKSWIQACSDTQSIVDPWQHLIEDTQAEQVLKFNLRLSLTAERNFLSGYNVSATPTVVPVPTEMKEIVECSGGRWQEGGARWLCVFSPADRALLPSLRHRDATLVSRESFLGAIMRQKLDASDILWD